MYEEYQIEIPASFMALYVDPGRQPIPAGEASVEHLVATSNGGAKDDTNGDE